MGGSQAGWIIPLAASQSDVLDFTIVVNGATVPLGMSVYWENITLDGELRSKERPGHLICLSDSEREELSNQLASFDGEYGFDPRQAIEMMSVPGIWLWGDIDPNVPTRECKAILEEIITEYDKPYSIYYEDSSGDNWSKSKGNKIIDWLNENILSE